MKTFLQNNISKCIKKLPLIVAILFACSTAAQISFLGSSKGTTPGNNSKTLTFQHTVNAGTNFLIVTATSQDKPIASVKYGNISLTPANLKTRGSMNVAIYYLINPTIGTDDIVIKTSQSTDLTGGAANYGNVNLTNPILAVASSSGQSSTASLSITTNIDEFVIDAIGTIASTANPSVAQTLIHNQASSHPNASSKRSALPSSTTTTWNISGSTDWAMVGIVLKSVPSGAPLPIKLKSFNAILAASNKVSINWTTSSEINASHFIVEKSFDGTEFTDAAMVFAAGNSTTDQQYAYTDNLSTNNTVIYYRLRSVDIDGKYEYSSVRVIRIQKQTTNEIKITVFPNPVQADLRITIPADWQNAQVTYEIYSANGLLVSSFTTKNSNQTESINVSQLPAGMYFVIVKSKGKTAKQQIIKY